MKKTASNGSHGNGSNELKKYKVIRISKNKENIEKKAEDEDVDNNSNGAIGN